MKNVEEKTNQPGPSVMFPLRFPLTFTAPISESETGTIDEGEPNSQNKGNLK